MNNETNSTRLVEVGQRIRSLRDARGLNLHELARLCGISAPALSLIETGKRDLRVTSLLRIADALRTPAGVLLDGDNHARAQPPSDQSEGYNLEDYT